MKNRDKSSRLMQTLGGLVLAGSLAFTGGCYNHSNQPYNQTSGRTITLEQRAEQKAENDAYEFALKLSKEKPKEFIHETFKNLEIYHDSSLELSKHWLFSGIPESGKGRYVMVDSNGDINTAEIDFRDKGITKSLGLGYETPKKYTNESVPEKINLGAIGSKTPFCIEYLNNNNGTWEKRIYDMQELNKMLKKEGAINEKDIPIKSRTQVNEKEVQKYLELVKQLKETYSEN